jgi:predicted benzoate:H+ symporter BenE
MIFYLLRVIGVIWATGFVGFALAATSAFLFSADGSPDRVRRWSARLTAALIWPIALLSSAGRVRLSRGF